MLQIGQHRHQRDWHPAQNDPASAPGDRSEILDGRRLRQILDGLKPPKGVGFIIRTAGVGKSKVEIERDLKYLTRLWETIEKKEKEPSPSSTESTRTACPIATEPPTPPVTVPPVTLPKADPPPSTSDP